MIFSLAITGPTASGKTALSLSLAERLSGEIICSDSMQIYKGMDIGTAKATAEERARAPHHLLDIAHPSENFSAFRYREYAIECAQKVTSRGNLPIFVGGTGLYINTLMRAPGCDVPEASVEYRRRILDKIQNDGDVEELWQRLYQVDPDSAEKIHKNNVKRVIRALEIYDATGVTKTELDRRSREPSPEIFVGMITLDFHNRDTLYARIDKRVDIMMGEGLVDEVSALYSRGAIPDGSTASQAIGYKEIISHLRGECTLSEAVDKIKLATRRYAKRQLTWFRNTAGACTLYMDDNEGNMRPQDEVVLEALAFAGDFKSRYLGETNEN
ncbi:MAG: tRNA (adenosine(37)-N6)-dimethylallyltransferase MiaA [Clostridia bacterium]|nr:tRNA (adenosine(37)-N6)-dimethylallyltransferase MiaA [Clostridia bacterium]